ncbi:hypothetical protein HNV08_14740 [Winogradskyella eckloniae]|uniref:hypothetical protein n=1 Tax=Winogradskyella eckloniae TaxID=1089306 RepID=UPI0015666F60|nr:hypothetical protein [Winogradskyella eckloniae]NRD21312.1 hypothetical protein [Winogradskyella eckloniae]
MKIFLISFVVLSCVLISWQGKAVDQYKFDSISTKTSLLRQGTMGNVKIEEKTYPVYRGCDKNLSFEETKKCTTEKIINYIKVSFNYELADKAFPTAKETQFQVDFIINEKGKTEEINVKAHHKAVAMDVIQLIKRMPKFKTVGTTNGQPVKTPFSALMTVYL